jgi:hypothetical protein
VNIRVGPAFWLVDPMVGQVVAEEVFNFKRGGVGKARPNKAEFDRRLFGYAAPIPQKPIPAENRTGNRAGRDLGVDSVPQPKQRPRGE